MIGAIAFYLFATLTILSAILVVFARNPVHSVLWLITAFFNAAGLVFLLGAEFIAIMLILVYVGAVAVLFLFIVMMLDIDFAKLRSGFTANLPFGLLIALVLLAELMFSRYLVPFELSGLILLVAMIGAIVLTHRDRGDTRGQKISRQVDRRPDEAVVLKQPQSGKGVEL